MTILEVQINGRNVTITCPSKALLKEMEIVLGRGFLVREPIYKNQSAPKTYNSTETISQKNNAGDSI